MVRSTIHDQITFNKLITPLMFCYWYFADDPRLCSISNPDFVVYSSIVSFYLPFLITLLVYIRIYFVLKKRRKRISLRQNSATVATKVAAQSQIIQVKENFNYTMEFVLSILCFSIFFQCVIELQCKKIGPTGSCRPSNNHLHQSKVILNLPMTAIRLFHAPMHWD